MAVLNAIREKTSNVWVVLILRVRDTGDIAHSLFSIRGNGDETSGVHDWVCD